MHTESTAEFVRGVVKNFEDMTKIKRLPAKFSEVRYNNHQAMHEVSGTIEVDGFAAVKFTAEYWQGPQNPDGWTYASAALTVGFNDAYGYMPCDVPGPVYVQTHLGILAQVSPILGMSRMVAGYIADRLQITVE